MVSKMTMHDSEIQPTEPVACSRENLGTACCSGSTSCVRCSTQKLNNAVSAHTTSCIAVHASTMLTPAALIGIGTGAAYCHVSAHDKSFNRRNCRVLNALSVHKQRHAEGCSNLQVIDSIFLDVPVHKCKMNAK